MENGIGEFGWENGVEGKIGFPFFGKRNISVGILRYDKMQYRGYYSPLQTPQAAIAGK